MNSPISLSPSRACDYRRCPLAYRLRAIDRIPEKKTEAQVKGTLTHAILENMHKWPRPERDAEHALAIMKEEWEKICEADPEAAQIFPPSHVVSFFADVEQLVRGYFTMENPQIFDATACEMKVDSILDNGVPIKGFIDRVDVAPTGEVRIIDYKTGKKPAPQYSEDALFQMRFYALAYWRIYGVMPKYMQLMYLKVQDSLYLTPSAEELEGFEKYVAHIWEQILSDGQTGHFEPRTSPLCKWCSFQSLCPVFDGKPPAYPGWPGHRTKEGLQN
ncbi:MAG: RecB family exonuclease [Corynebacterium sp.]|nr:RecB family exonuclease [Corynebacterium sp.]